MMLAAWNRLHPDAATAAAAGGLALLWAFVTAARRTVTPPSSGPVIPTARPPDGLCPAAARYLTRMRYDVKCLLAALVAMAANGCLTIEKYTSRKYRLSRPAGADPSVLSPAEQVVAARLLPAPGAEPLNVHCWNWETFKAAGDELNAHLAGAHRGRSFAFNRGWLWAGAALALAILIAVTVTAARTGAARGVLAAPMLIAAFTVWPAAVLGRGAAWLLRYGRKRSALMLFFCGLVALLFGGPIALLVLAMLATTVNEGSIYLAVFATAVGLTLDYLSRRLRQPTPAGTEIYSQLDAFAESIRGGNAGSRPGDWLARNIAYVVALDATDDASETAGTFRPAWFIDSGGSPADGGPNAIAELAGPFTDALASARLNPSRTSDSST